MSKDLIISSNRHETKVGILEDEQLVEIYFQRTNEYSLVGSIHKGRVTRVLPGMQSAFVDIGLERDAFLYVSDFFEESEDYEPIEPREEKATGPARTEAAGVVAEPADTKDKERDRKGRRSRRRRNRGRSFPDSKYAPDARTVSQRPAAPERQDEIRQELFVLPGESLAKYAHAEEESAGRELEDSEEPVSTGADDTVGPSRLPTGAPEEGEEETGGELTGEGPNQLEEAAAVGTWVETKVPEVEVQDTDFTEGATERLEEGSFHDDEDSESEEGVPLEEEKSSDDNWETGDSEAESEDSDIKEMILGQLDDEVRAALEADDEDAGQEAAAAGTSDSSKVDSAEPRGSVTVREQEPRYMHRVVRRGRRRDRGGRVEAHEDKKDARPDDSNGSPKSEQRTVTRPEKPLPSIADLLKEGQEILVQIAKEPLGQKGARITSHIALPGRYVVYMPTLDHLGVSRKISSDEERQRLRRILQTSRVGIPGGFIMRTAGAGKSEKEIAADMNFLFNLWMDIRKKAEKRPAPALLHHDLQVVERVLRDQVTDDFNTIWVDNEDAYEEVLRFVQRFQPSLVRRVRMYTRPLPIFDAFNITQELEKALRPKVWLKSGGYIVINQTEALVAIDINTGKFVGKSNRLEDTIVKTNIEAVNEITRQMRLRDLGGIIVVDFIDMDERKNRQKVMQSLEEAMRRDRAPYKILQFNDFGLVAITRKRVKQSLERTLCSPCPYCDSAGYVKSVDTIIGDILSEAHKMVGVVEGEDVMLRVHPDVARVLKARGKNYLQELEEILGRPVMVTSDPVLHHEKFDLA